MSLAVEFKDVSGADGGLRLELWVDGVKAFTGTAGREALEGLKALLGMDRKDAVRELRTALLEALKNQLKDPKVSEPLEQPPGSYHWVGFYAYRSNFYDSVTLGPIWFDWTAEELGPQPLEPWVATRFRLACHRQVREPDKKADGWTSAIRGA